MHTFTEAAGNQEPWDQGEKHTESMTIADIPQKDAIPHVTLTHTQ